MLQPDPSVAREHLEKIVASPGFHNSERLCRFLRFIVEAKLRGEQDQIKEYVIGKEVFDRDGEYDPRIDPIVRVEARRLRKKLDEYYAGPGLSDAIRIEFPKGAYVPEIHPAQAAAVEQAAAVAAAAPARPFARWIPAAIAAALVVIGLSLWLWPRPRHLAAVVAVVPARWIWQGEDFPDLRHDEDLAERVAARLAAGGKVKTIAWPQLQRFRDGRTDLAPMGRQLGATRMIVVAVRVEADGFRVTAYLIDVEEGGRKLNVVDKRNQPLGSPQAREAVAAALAAGFEGR